MSPEHVEKIEKIAFDGPLAPWQGILLGGVLMALLFWTLFRGPAKARSRFAPLFVLLRVVAIVIVVWMLLGPVHQTIYRHLTPKSLAVVTDVSRSMNVVDPPDKKADLRWNAVTANDAASTLLAACDRVTSAATMARDQLDWLLRHATSATESERTRRKLKTATRAAATAVTQSENVSRLLDEGRESLGPELVARGKDVTSALAASRLNQLNALAGADSSGPLALSRSALDQIEQCHGQLVRSVRALGQFADRVADRLAVTHPAVAPTESLEREGKVHRLLEQGEKSWLAGRDESARIRHYAFDRQTFVLPGDDDAKVADTNASVAGGDQKKIAADGAAPTSAKKRAAPVTNLTSVLERVNRDASQSGIEAVVLFTDGRHNDPTAEDPRAVAKTLGEIPVYVVPVGSSQMQRDVILHHVNAPTAVVEGDQMVVEAIVSAYDCAGEKCVVELSEGKSVIDRKELDITSARRDCRVRLTTPSKGVGRHQYALNVAPLKGEAGAANNTASFGVDVIDASLKILVADDLPRWEYRYLLRLFERDKRVQFEQLLFQPTERASGELAARVELPHDVEGWSRYRLAILGDLNPTQFDAQSQKALKEYLVDRGGTVILIAGTQSMPAAFEGMPLADFIPVTAATGFDATQGFELALSAEGRLNPAMQIADPPETTEQVWKEMSQQLPVYGLSNYCVPKPTARTLIDAVAASGGESGKNEKVFLCWQAVGRGRVVYLAAPAVYQLRMKYGDRYHYRFWGQLIRWAVARDLAQGSKTVKLATDRSRVSVGENFQIMASLNDLDGRPVQNAEVRIQASTDGSATSLIPMTADPKIPGRYLGEFTPTDEGNLSLQAFGTDVTQLLQSEGVSKPVTMTIPVDPQQSAETEDTRSNVPLLSQIARLTGGQIVAPEAIGQVVELTDLEPKVREETVGEPLWDRWKFLWLLCGVLTAEWTLRKLTGLP